MRSADRWRRELEVPGYAVERELGDVGLRSANSSMLCPRLLGSLGGVVGVEVAVLAGRRSPASDRRPPRGTPDDSGAQPA